MTMDGAPRTSEEQTCKEHADAGSAEASTLLGADMGGLWRNQQRRGLHAVGVGPEMTQN